MQHQPGELAPIETSAFYDALKSIDVDDGLAREATEEALARTKIPDNVTASAIYRALCSRNCDVEVGVTSRNGKNRTLRPIERWAGPELALFNLLVQPPAMVQNIVGKELDRLGHARVGVPGSGRSCSPKRSRCGDRAWRSPEPSLSGRTL